MRRITRSKLPRKRSSIKRQRRAPSSELKAEIATLARLESLANAVRRSGEDRKWRELASLLGEIFTPAASFLMTRPLRILLAVAAAFWPAPSSFAKPEARCFH